MFTKSRIFILILTLICFVVWLASDLIATPPSYTPDDATTKALLPLNSEFDKSTLELISKMNFTPPPFTKTSIKPNIITPPSPRPSPSSVATRSATLQP